MKRIDDNLVSAHRDRRVRHCAHQLNIIEFEENKKMAFRYSSEITSKTYMENYAILLQKSIECITEIISSIIGSESAVLYGHLFERQRKLDRKRNEQTSQIFNE